MMALGILLVVVVLIVAAAVTIYRRNQERKQQEALEKQQQEEAAAQEEAENNTLHIRAVGDNLIHDAFIETGSDRTKLKIRKTAVGSVEKKSDPDDKKQPASFKVSQPKPKDDNEEN